MKKKSTAFLGIAAILIVAMFTMTACDDGSGGSTGGNDTTAPTLTGNVKINGTMEVGQDATAVVENSNGTAGKFTYQWTKTDNGGSLTITDKTGATYTITEADVGHKLGVDVENTDTTGKISSPLTNKVVFGEPATKSFPATFDFKINDESAIRNAVIKDERIQAGTLEGSKTLEEIMVEVGNEDKSIIDIIEDAIMNAFNTTATGVLQQNRFRNVFGVEGGVTIIVDNAATAYKLKATDKQTIYIHINYLKTNQANLQQNMFDAVTAMNASATEYPFTISKAIINDTQVRLASVGAMIAATAFS
jgi:hypothetical protein